MDDKHDSYAVQHLRKLIFNHLEDVGYRVIMCHEFTDGCSAQYKSRHCMGDVALSHSDFGLHTFRNYFETSHAKGEQDAVGLYIKQKVGMAVLRGEVSVRSAQDMYQYLERNFTDPVCDKTMAFRRVFLFAGNSDIKRNGIQFQIVSENRKLRVTV